MTTKELGFSDKLQNAVTFAESVKTLTVTNAAEHAEAGQKIIAIRELEKELAAEYSAHPIVMEAKKIQAMKSELEKILEAARKTAKARQMAWEDAQEVIRRAEESRLAAIAKKQADEDALALAQAAQDAGDKDEAIAVLEAAVIAPAPIVVVAKTAPKTANRRKIMKFEVTNEALLPRQYLSPDQVKIGGVVRSLGEAANIPGVRIWTEWV